MAVRHPFFAVSQPDVGIVVIDLILLPISLSEEQLIRTTVSVHHCHLMFSGCGGRLTTASGGFYSHEVIPGKLNTHSLTNYPLASYPLTSYSLTIHPLTN